MPAKKPNQDFHEPKKSNPTLNTGDIKFIEPADTHPDIENNKKRPGRKPTNNEKVVKKTISIHPSVWNQAVDYSAQRYASVSYIIQQALMEYIKNHL